MMCYLFCALLGPFNIKPCQTLRDRSLAGKLQKPLFAVKGRDDPRDLRGA